MATTRRNRLIALICGEAFLWIIGTQAFVVLPLDRRTIGSTAVTLIQMARTVALALALIFGMQSRAWQAAIALNLLACAPAVIAMALTAHPDTIEALALVNLIVPLAGLGWCVWLLRFVHAEFAT